MTRSVFFVALLALAVVGGTSAKSLGRGNACDTADRLAEVNQRVDDFWITFDKYTINSNAFNWTAEQNMAFAVSFVNEYFTAATTFIVNNGIPAQSFNISGLPFLTAVVAGLPVSESGGERRMFDKRRIICSDSSKYSFHADVSAIARAKVFGNNAQRAAMGTTRMDFIREVRGGPLKVLRVWNEFQSTYRAPDSDLSRWNPVTNDEGF